MPITIPGILKSRRNPLLNRVPATMPKMSRGGWVAGHVWNLRSSLPPADRGTTTSRTQRSQQGMILSRIQIEPPPSSSPLGIMVQWLVQHNPSASTPDMHPHTAAGARLVSITSGTRLAGHD
jgi:hypothetical protein